MASPPPRIRVLPAELADQIAAGEVVERPASVVKELVENALDAGARRIEISIEGGGLRRIVVSDDGGGMSPEEAHLAVRRHATSKLKAIDDLFALQTMGFRGEALPSIAAVSELALTTRTRDDESGYRLEVTGGVVGEGRPVGAPVGTEVVVARLLGNVPARLKFMKSQSTESAHVTETVLRLALAHPHIHLRLRSEGRTSIDLPPHASGFERARVALSRGGRLPLELHLAAGEEHGVHVEAYLGSPAEATGTSRNTYTIVNRRFVRDRGLLQALHMGYGELLDKGRYPLAVVQVTLPGRELDVNVHPQKLEVRFARPQDTYAAVRHTVARAVAQAPWLAEPPEARSAMRVYSFPPLPRAAEGEPRLGYAEHRRRAADALHLFAPPPSLPGFGEPGAEGAGRPGDAPPARNTDGGLFGGGRLAATGAALLAAAQQGGAGADPSSTAGAGWSLPVDARGRTLIPPGPLPSPGAMGPGPTGGPPPPTPAAAQRFDERASTLERRQPADRFFASLSYLGQLDRTYLVCEAPGELVLIDQHAAHERVAFQRLRDAAQKRGMRTQRLLLPLPVDLDERLRAAAADHRALLGALGFELELTDGGVALGGVPETLGRAAPAELLGELLAELADVERPPADGATSDDALPIESRVVQERVDHALATIACHSVVRAGDTLSPTEVRALLESMDGIDYRAHCPHGRPVLLRISIGELERRFGRT